jgi:hypothetical protein
MMTTQEVAARLHELCSQGQFSTAQAELFHPDAESFEPEYSPMPYAKGLEAITAKGEAFQADVVEMHGATLGQPSVAGNYFCLTMGIDATFKAQGRVFMEEVCVYKVVEGKVVEERFFY